MEDAVLLAVEREYDFPEFGGYLGNVGLAARMAKSKKRRKQAVATEAAPRGGLSQGRIAAGAIALALAVGAGWWWYASQQAENAFFEHARRGEPALARVVKHPDEGRGHLAPGESVRYQSNPPTSGVHDPQWIDPGVYQRVQSREKLVHSLEHGMVVAYYDQPPEAVRAALEGWTRMFSAPWSGMVLAPKPGLGEAIILAAWRRTLELDPFDADAAAAFIDAYRGRGPEHPVR